MQEGSPGFDDPPQKSSVHVSQTKSKKTLEEKKNESPLETNFKIENKKQQASLY